MYQKGNLENEIKRNQEYLDFTKSAYGKEKASTGRVKSIKNAKDLIEGSKKLKQYDNPSAHFRMVREEIKRAQEDGMWKIRFPTGETAMKIEGLGDETSFSYVADDMSKLVEHLEGGGDFADFLDENMNPSFYPLSAKPELMVGEVIHQEASDSLWVITDVLGGGKFKAVDWDSVDGHLSDVPESAKETFDISGKIDTSNPIYKFYEKDLQKYVKNNFKAERIKDDKGVEWLEVDLDKNKNYIPQAFGFLPFFGLGKKKENTTESFPDSGNDMSKKTFLSAPDRKLNIQIKPEDVDEIVNGIFAEAYHEYDNPDVVKKETRQILNSIINSVPQSTLSFSELLRNRLDAIRLQDPQYLNAKSGKLDYLNRQKYNIIKNEVEKIMREGIKDTNDGKIFYLRNGKGPLKLYPGDYKSGIIK